MRYKSDHKQETHRRIVETSSESFRMHGFDSVGVAKLMAANNLTHGGFYAHFSDKEQLIAESGTFVLEQWLEIMLKVLDKQGFVPVINFYLSEEHRDNPATGCFLPALATEIARHSGVAQTAYTEKLSALFDALAEHIPDGTMVQKRARVYALFAAMVGAVVMARSVSDDALSNAILESTRTTLLKEWQNVGVL